MSEEIKACPVPSCGAKSYWVYGDYKVSCTVCAMSVGGYEKGEHEPCCEEVIALWNSLQRNEWVSVEEVEPEGYAEYYIYPRPEFSDVIHTGVYRPLEKNFICEFDNGHFLESHRVDVTHYRVIPQPPKEQNANKQNK